MNLFRRRWLTFWALLCAALVVFCVAVRRPVRVHLQALAVVRQVAGQPVPRVSRALTQAVMREDLTLRIEGQEVVRAREYLPVHQPNAPAMVIFHGVHHLGIDEPRLVAFAAAMASCGIRILTPELPDIKDYRVSESSVQTIGGSVKWFAERTGGPVGVMGLSFSGGLALVAATDPLYHRDFKFVMAVGSQDSMARVTDYYRTGSDLRPDGTLERLAAHEYGPLVLEYEYLEDFIPARDLAPVRAVLRAHLYEDRDGEAQASLALNDLQKREALELMDSTSAATHARILETAQKHAREMAGLSPGGRLEGLKTPVYLLHGEGDNIIPAAETLWMASELPRTELKAVLVSPVISHLDLDGRRPRCDGLLAPPPFLRTSDAGGRERLTEWNLRRVQRGERLLNGPTQAENEAMVTLEDVRAAQQRIAPAAVRTGLHRVSQERLDASGFSGVPFTLYIKAESEQPIGSFKLRGGYNRIALLTGEELRRGVITYSSGNHAQAVAYAARALGGRAVIVMPENAPLVKREATAAMGAEIVLVGPASSERKAKAEELAAQHGYTIIPPYDDPGIIAGQGTCGLEILDQLGPDTVEDALILSPVSGGGLLSGIATAVKLSAPASANVQVWGAEPELAADAKESFETKRLVEWPAAKTTRTICDGLRTQSLGNLNFEHILSFVDGITTVSDDEVRTAMRVMLQTTGLVAEPSGAVALAAALFRRDQLPQSRTVVAVLSGGNVEPELRQELETGTDGTLPVKRG